MVDRTPRSLTGREQTSRPTKWKRPSMLPTPDPRDGLRFRWIRTSSLGVSDMPNVSSRFREGYTPVLAKDFPELKILSDINSRFRDNIEVGGLLLCSIPSEVAQERIDGQEDLARSQIESVDSNYQRESDPRMPVLKSERKSRTTFGQG